MNIYLLANATSLIDTPQPLRIPKNAINPPNQVNKWNLPEGLFGVYSIPALDPNDAIKAKFRNVEPIPMASIFTQGTHPRTKLS